jgi:hypothetical protein
MTMPTFDGGHCFLTALLPIKTSEVVDQDGLRNSPVHMVRDALAILPTARQSPVTETLPVTAPFAKCTKTHFARFAIIDDAIFNGRLASNAILDSLKGLDRTIPKPVDQLPGPYLMMAIDFDAPDGTDAELRGYLKGMWNNMGAELAPVFRHCFGYDETAGSAEGFADYIISCQLETTMPFNDYWPSFPPLTTISKPLLAISFLVPALVVGLGVYFALSAMGLIAHRHTPWLYCAEILAIVLLSIAVGLCVVYRMVMARGEQPLPAAPNSDLRAVLKALYLQRELIAFAIKMQGQSAADLTQAFGAFLDKNRVQDTDSPTQQPGTIMPYGTLV